MRKLTDELIEHAFKEIRSDFEKRANDQGLEILDSCEEQWNTVGYLTDRQTAWLEKQLNGSWRPSVKPGVEKDETASAIPELRPGVDEISSTVQGPGQLLDAIIHQRLAEEGKVIVDRNRLNKLEQVIDELNRAIQSLR